MIHALVFMVGALVGILAASTCAFVSLGVALRKERQMFRGLFKKKNGKK